MKIILDLDYTLLDSKKLKEEGLSSFFGVTAQKFVDFYEKNFKKRDIHYNPREHIRISEPDCREEEKMKELAEFMKRKIKKYLFPAAEDMLKQLKRSGNELILMTRGNADWHKLKIDSLPEIKKYFDKIIYIDKDKSDHELLRSLKESGEKILVINDNAAESLKIKEVLGGHCEIRLVEGPYSHNIEGGYKGRLYGLEEIRNEFLTEGEGRREGHLKIR